MSKVLVDMLSDKGNLSSARIINIAGAITGTVVVVYYTLYVTALSADIFGIYMAYCAGVYSAGKLIDRKYDGGNVVSDSKRFEINGDSGSSRNIDSPDFEGK